MVLAEVCTPHACLDLDLRILLEVIRSGSGTHARAGRGNAIDLAHVSFVLRGCHTISRTPIIVSSENGVSVKTGPSSGGTSLMYWDQPVWTTKAESREVNDQQNK